MKKAHSPSGHIKSEPLQLPVDPIDGVLQWLELATKSGQLEPTAMTLATTTLAGQPSARIVLLKGVSPAANVSLARRGFEFFTNFESRKSMQLSENPRAALVFYWATLKRQIRIEGVIERLTAEESNQYFQSRPRDSQIGAWSSPQSRSIHNRDELKSLLDAAYERFGDGAVPCPPHWGGWRLVPELIEFWEERPFRLHERREFIARVENGKTVWDNRILAP